MEKLAADYLVIGAGAVSMAFVDTMLDETDATFIMVDRHHMPGGHWNDAYPFVRLHQPSAFYGVASTDLGSDTIDTFGPNEGLYELASGQEVATYFEQIMHHRFLKSGRVKYFPMSDYLGEGRFKSLLSGKETGVEIGKSTVDGTFFNTSVPSMHKRKFAVDDGVACVPPNDLPNLAPKYKHFTILGGGKTAMDAGVWLLEAGAKPEQITWVCPRASWLIDRMTSQPGKAFFQQSAGGFSKQLEAILAGDTVEEVFLGMEERGVMLRIHDDVMPTMFHYATISRGEAAQLKRIAHVVRNERVKQITPTEMKMESGTSIKADAETLYIDCTATAVQFTDARTQPIFEPGRITLQAVFAPLVTYSAAVIAKAEASFDDDAKKNALCVPVELADTPTEWMSSVLGNMTSQMLWSQDPEMKAWVGACRLNPSAAAMAEGALKEPANGALMAKIGQNAMPAAMKLQKLISELPKTG